MGKYIFQHWKGVMKGNTTALNILLCSLIIVLSWAVPSMFPYYIEDEAYRLVDYTRTASLPGDFMEIQDSSQRKRVLIETILPLVLKANEEIIAQRAELLRIKKTSFYLTMKERRFIEELAVYYKVGPSDHRAMLDELIVRVDVLPASLVLAQAAIESGWGTSRFALEGNNIFGIRNSRGLGMVPRKRSPGSTFALSTFDDLQACIDFHIWNINTHPEYEHLRKIRTHGCSPYNPVELAQGLNTYSEMGYAYVGKVVDTIERYNLKSYDTFKPKQDPTKVRLVTASSS